MPVFDFRIHVCPKCGSISVARKICNICGASTIGTSFAVQDLLKSNTGSTKTIKTSLTVLSAKYCVVTEQKKYASKKKTYRKKFLSDTWKILKRSVRVCLKCGHIAGVSCFFKSEECCICGTAYIDSKIRCQNYYNRGQESDAYLENRQIELREKLCVKSALYDVAAWSFRIDVEKDRLPIRLEAQLSDYSILPDAGAIPALLNIPDSLRAGKEHLWNIFSAFQHYLSKYIFLLDNTAEPEYANYLTQLQEFLSDAFNILRLQYFAGQQDAVDMMSEYIVDLVGQISN